MLINIHIIIQYNKIMQIDFSSHFRFHHFGVCYKDLTNTFIKYQYFYLIKGFNNVLYYIICKDSISGSYLENIELDTLYVT